MFVILSLSDIMLELGWKYSKLKYNLSLCTKDKILPGHDCQYVLGLSRKIVLYVQRWRPIYSWDLSGPVWKSF